MVVNELSVTNTAPSARMPSGWPDGHTTVLPRTAIAGSPRSGRGGEPSMAKGRSMKKEKKKPKKEKK